MLRFFIRFFEVNSIFFFQGFGKDPRKYFACMRWVRQCNNCSPPFCTSSTAIPSGPGAELLFQFFMAYFMCVTLKKISEVLVWFSSKTESISSSISCLNCKSNSFFPIFSMWNFWSFSYIFLSSKMCRPDSVS